MDNTMAEERTMIHKTLHRKLQIEQQKSR